jgi:hypothetical protein
MTAKMGLRGWMGWTFEEIWRRNHGKGDLMVKVIGKLEIDLELKSLATAAFIGIKPPSQTHQTPNNSSFWKTSQAVFPSHIDQGCFLGTTTTTCVIIYY